MQKIFEEVFGECSVQVKSYGKVLAAIALLQGLVVEDLKPKELDVSD